MRSLRLPRLCVVLVLLASSRALGGQVTINDVPSYIWYGGCGPTAAGMIIGYWDAHGYPNLITAGDGTNSWTANQQAVKDMMASPEHFYDYWGYGKGKDRVPPPPFHSNNSVADFMGASKGTILEDGASYENKQYVGMVGYANYCGYSNASGFYAYFGSLWDIYVAEINAGRPMEFFVDPTGGNIATHFVTAIGYDDTPGALKYACYDTYDLNVHWYTFAGKASGQLYGIQSGSVFALPSGPATLQWQGPFVGNTWDVGITANWLGDTGDYRTFRNGDNVQFGDFLVPTATVNVSAVVTPGAVVVNNSMTAYEFTGAGSIAGPCKLTKTGAGTLVLGGSNTHTGGTEVSGGTLLVKNTAGSATGTGAVTVIAATLGGTGFINGPVTLTGDATLTSTGTLTINNTLTIQGLANQLAAGTVLTTGDVTIEPEAVFIVNGTLGGGTGSLVIYGTLMGKGTINKSLSLEAGGVLSPGEPSTIQGMAQILNAAAPRNFSFEIGAASPNYASPSNSLNDLVRLTDDAMPFADASGESPAALSADTVIDVYFLWSDPALGEYKAEFFAATDFSDAVAGATYQYWRLNPRGSRYHNGNFFSPLDASLVDWSVVPETATFDGQAAGGYITEFEVVPEPATLALVALGWLLSYARIRRKA
jgi:autotransporter-associated beta strand protein